MNPVTPKDLNLRKREGLRRHTFRMGHVHNIVYSFRNGFFFVILLSLITYFKTLKRLKERKISEKISVEEVFFELSRVEKIIERNGREYLATIPKRAKKMIINFSDMLPMG